MSVVKIISILRKKTYRDCMWQSTRYENRANFQEHLRHFLVLKESSCHAISIISLDSIFSSFLVHMQYRTTIIETGMNHPITTKEMR